MSEIHRFTSVSFRNYKALKNYSVSLEDFNVMVGPNNSGKSTIIGAFRILAEGMRQASARKPEYFDLPDGLQLAYRVALGNLPVATENIFSDYDESDPAVVEFRFSNGNKLAIIFPEPNLCYLVCKTEGKPVRSPSSFKREYKASVGFVPVLGPVEHNERLYQPEAARLALLTHRASRNFRNIWYHYPEDFEEFRGLINSTWPGMDIEKPKIEYSYNDKPVLHMFCPEERFLREIYWAGFGFQVWCQMLTYIVRAKNDSLLVIDEPDIYLHSDLQRQLVSLLKNIEQDVLIATHSTEIISEVDPGDLLVINKKVNSAKRINDPSQLQSVFNVLGSNLNPTLTQLAKSKRAIFVEGKDFKTLALFARKLKKQAVANGSDFAVIPVEGFNPQKMKNFSEGIELALGIKFKKAVVFDRDYRSDDEIAEVRDQLNRCADLVHIHSRKEIENYLLVPTAIDRAITQSVAKHNKRTSDDIKYTDTVDVVLGSITSKLKNRITAQYLARRTEFKKTKKTRLDETTISQRLLDEFEEIWSNLPKRLEIVPGKEIMSELNKHLQGRYKITLSPRAIINAMHADEVPEEIKKLIIKLDEFRLHGMTDRTAGGP